MTKNTQPGFYVAKIFCVLFIALTSCQTEIFDRADPSFIVSNESGQEAMQVSVYARDGDLDNSNTIGKRKTAVLFENIKAYSDSDLKTTNLKKISSLGEGDLSVEVIMASGDTLALGIGVYKRNRIYTEFLPSSWQTIIIEIDSKLSLKSQYARHHNGKFEKYGV